MLPSGISHEEAARTAATFGITSSLSSLVLTLGLVVALWSWRPRSRAKRALRTALWPTALCAWAAGSSLNSQIWFLVTGKDFTPTTSFSEWLSATTAVSLVLVIPIFAIAWSALPPDRPVGADGGKPAALGYLGRVIRSTEFRSWLLRSLMWVLSSIAFCFIFDPFEEVWYGDTPVRSFGLTVFPPSIYGLWIVLRPLVPDSSPKSDQPG